MPTYRPLIYLLALLGASLAIQSLSGCQPTPEPTPTAIPSSTPTATEPVTPTLEPTEIPNTITPIPTETPAAAPPTLTPAPTIEIVLTPTPTPSGIVEIAAVGDIMLDRTLGIRILDGDINYPFRDVREPLQDADYTIGNLESALGESGEPFEGKAFPFQAPPEAADTLANAGFDLVSLANNHAMDYGPESLLEGIELLDAVGIDTVGAGINRDEAHAPHIETINGVTIGFLAYVNVFPEENLFDVEVWDATETEPGLAWGRPDEIAADVARLKPEVDHVIVIMHFGWEYVRTRTIEQAELGRAAIDAGATLVIGHHSHLLQGVSRYQDGMIAYGLGNFAFDIDGDNRTAILQVTLDREEIIRVDAVPAVIKVGGAPRLANEEEAEEIFGYLGDLDQFTKRAPESDEN